ncbi:MAG TPA: sigma-54-dependent Fis family transcriptional regulator [Pseudomonas sp.]|nr:sigma-54-dependent Fis family transcriptional regulator [Pseudomonas sp.]
MKSMAIKVLLVEDDRALREALADTLLLGGHDYTAVASAEEALAAVGVEAFNLVLSDVNMPGMDGHQLLGLLRVRQPQLPVLLMTAHGAVERAVDAMRQGAADYLVKPFEPKTLLDLVARHALGSLSSTESEGPVAFEPASAQLLELAARVARSDSTVLISGESGTGKEVLARYIHQHSRRASQPFIAINCAAIPDNMLEATLFGHEKGSFTGAIAAQAGKFEQADGGTILLDEISEMPLGLQAKLLRVLQEKEFEPVGSNEVIQSDVRVIAATSTDLQAAIKRGEFRADLYYRLNVLPIQVPPLRDRLDDLPALSEAILEELRSQHELNREALELLGQHAWPGNIRELRNVLERAALLSDDLMLNAMEIRAAIGTLMPVERVAPLSIEAVAHETFSQARERFDRQLIESALAQCGGKVIEAAARLGLGRSTLYKKMVALGIAESL